MAAAWCRLLRLQVALLLCQGLLAGLLPRYDITPDRVAASATPLQEAAVRSVTHCALLCQGHLSCWAFNYMSGGVCQLLQETMELCAPGGGAPLLGAQLGVICPRTCLQVLRQQPASPSGLYQLAGWPVPVLCDQELDGGGWTLLLSSVSSTWTEDGTVTLVTGRNQQQPNISTDYSILELGGRLLSFGTGDRFVYRLEGQAGTGRQQWGGIWSAPRVSSLVRYAPDVPTQLVTRFGEWTTDDNTIEDRLPWINLGYFSTAPQLEFVLTTSDDGAFWGTLVSRVDSWHNSPWLRDIAPQSGNVLYWVREDE